MMTLMMMMMMIARGWTRKQSNIELDDGLNEGKRMAEIKRLDDDTRG